MPKAVNHTFPLEGLFGLIKPSGCTSMSLLDQLKLLLRESPMFVPDDHERDSFINARKAGRIVKGKSRKVKDAVKMGQGGTLDPLADGVLVIGVNKGTKSLSQFLDCSKEYYTTAILGCETDTYDSDGAIVRTAPSAHVTRKLLEDALSAFRGEIAQLPPIYSALKMDGRALYDYARKGDPLPRPIQARKVNVLSIEVIDWQEAAVRPETGDADKPSTPGHTYTWPTKRLDAEKLSAMESVRKLIATAGVDVASESLEPTSSSDTAPGGSSSSSNVVIDTPSADSSADATSTQQDTAEYNPSSPPPVFTLKMTVSSGTYVRSIVHDLAHAVGSSATVVSLSRTRQGEFGVGPKYPACLTAAEKEADAAAAAAGLSGAAKADPVNNPSDLCQDTDSRPVVEESIEKLDAAEDVSGDCIPWEVFERAIKAREADKSYTVAEGEREEWEELVLERIQAPK